MSVTPPHRLNSPVKKINRKVRLGICAMDKKVNAKPMKEILQRLNPAVVEIIKFGDDVICSKPIEEWPVCDALFSFYSSKFPLDKAIAYQQKVKPFSINSLPEQVIFE